MSGRDPRRVLIERNRHTGAWDVYRPHTGAENGLPGLNGNPWRSGLGTWDEALEAAAEFYVWFPDYRPAEARMPGVSGR